MHVTLFVVCPECSKNGYGFYEKIESINEDNEVFTIQCPECKEWLKVEIVDICTSASSQRDM